MEKLKRLDPFVAQQNWDNQEHNTKHFTPI